jgi:hypothetical protein
MKIVLKRLRDRCGAKLVTVVCDLVRVHHRSGHFDRASEVEVVVALVVRELLDCALRKSAVVLSNDVVHWTGGGNRSVMRYHVEVELIGALVQLNKTLINNGSFGRVQHILAVLLEEPGIGLFVDKDI